MRGSVARLGRLALAAALAYLTVGIVWETAFDLALTPSGVGDISPWNGPLSFLAWFVLPSVVWPSSMSAFVPESAGGARLVRCDDRRDVRSAHAPGAGSGRP